VDFAFDGMQIGVAHGADGDLDPHLAGARARVGDLFALQRVLVDRSGEMQTQGFHIFIKTALPFWAGKFTTKPPSHKEFLLFPSKLRGLVTWWLKALGFPVDHGRTIKTQNDRL
jgi:hypothetical protein